MKGATATSRTVTAMIHATPIRRDAEGRYCPNDLHRAAGGNKKHQPSDFIRMESTQALAAALSNSGISRINPIDLSRGRYGGTYVHKMLALDYSAWISSEFKLAAYTAFEEHTQASETDMGTFMAPAGTPLSSMLMTATEALQVSSAAIPSPLFRLLLSGWN